MSIERLHHVLLQESPSFEEKWQTIRTYGRSCSEEGLRALAGDLREHSNDHRKRGEFEQAYRDAILCAGLGWVGQSQYAVAMGRLINGNILNGQGRYDKARQSYTRASLLFDRVGAEVMWARTQIGLLYALSETGKNEERDITFSRAERILIDAGAEQRGHLFNLYLNMAAIARAEGRYPDQRDLLNRILVQADRNRDAQRIATAFDGLGFYYSTIGESEAAGECLRWAITILEEAHIKNVDYYAYYGNLAFAEYNLGRLQSALKLLTKPLRYITDHSSRSWMYAKLTQVECYRMLNWHDRAEEAAKMLIETAQGAELATAQRELGLAQAEQGFSTARGHLVEALRLFFKTGNRAEALITRLRIHQLAAADEDLTPEALRTALHTARELVADLHQRHREQMEARLLVIRLLVRLGDALSQHVPTEAARTSAEASHALDEFMADLAPSGDEALWYSAQNLRGHIFRTEGRRAEAIATYTAATQIVEEMQRDLAISFRPGFLGDKGEALHHIIQLHLEAGETGEAFNALERNKSAIFWSWSVLDATNAPTQQESLPPIKARLDALHAEYNDLLRARRRTPEDVFAQKDRDLRAEIHLALQELFAQTSNDDVRLRQGLGWEKIAGHLPPDSLLLMYYDDGRRLSLFTLDSAGKPPRWFPLKVSLADLSDLLSATDRVIRETLQWFALEVHKAPDSSYQQHLEAAANWRFGAARQQAFNAEVGRIYEYILGPIAHELSQYNQLIFVPYQRLHNFPFHLLYQRQSGQYLIERFVVSSLPTASLILPREHQRQAGALIAWDDLDEQLDYSAQTAEAIAKIFPNSRVMPAKHHTLNEIFSAANRQILHLIAHGEFDPKFPEMSKLYLGNNKHLSLIDLLYQPLNCDLVALTACDVGQGFVSQAVPSKYATGDDVLGLARAFLYAGSGSLLTSTWQIADGFSIPFNDHFYRALLNGESKASALQTAQRAMREGYPNLHPIFWGAFQLIGDPGPLQ